MFAIHWGYSEISKKTISNCFFTSPLIFSAISGIILLRFWLTGWNSGLSGKWCSTMLVSKLGISWYDQAKTSTHSWRNLTNSGCTCSSRDAPILTYFMTSSEPRLITSLGFWWDWIYFWSCLRSLASSVGNLHSSSPSSSTWLIGNPELQGIFAMLLPMDLFSLHVYELIFRMGFMKSVKEKEFFSIYFYEK